MIKGKVYLVGAGPGDPQLITIKGKQAIEKADVIVYDRLVSTRLLRERQPHAELIFVGKNPDFHTLAQTEINELLVKLASENKRVIRLKGGDPAVFGRVGEEAEALANHGIEYEIIPGVSSAIAVPAYAGIPVTHRDFSSSVTILTGHECVDKSSMQVSWAQIAKAEGTLVFLMGLSNIAQIVEKLICHGKPPHTPVAVIQYGTTRDQLTITGSLEDIVPLARKYQLSAPATIVIGEVVRLREKLAWVEKKPLFGLNVLVTRAMHQASELVNQIEALGGEVTQFPVISIQRSQQPETLQQIQSVFMNFMHFDWVLFTSANGVHYFFLECRERKIDIRSLCHLRFAVIGPKTLDALLHYGIFADIQAKTYDSEGLWLAIQNHLHSGQHLLLPTANLASQELKEQLIGYGVQVTQIEIYQNTFQNLDEEQAITKLQKGKIDIITFTSSSTIHFFMQALREQGIISPEHHLERCKLACIGPKTVNTLREYGLHAQIIANEATIESLVQAIIEQK